MPITQRGSYRRPGRSGSKTSRPIAYVTRSVKDLAPLRERFGCRSPKLSTRAPPPIMAAVSQWECEAGPPMRCVTNAPRASAPERAYGVRVAADGLHVEPDDAEQAAVLAITEVLA